MTESLRVCLPALQHIGRDRWQNRSNGRQENPKDTSPVIRIARGIGQLSPHSRRAIDCQSL